MKKTLFIHTFLFGIFPVLFLYAHNIKKIPIDALFRPLTVAFIFAVFIWLLFYSYPWIILDLFGNNVINNSAGYCMTIIITFIINVALSLKYCLKC